MVQEDVFLPLLSLLNLSALVSCLLDLAGKLHELVSARSPQLHLQYDVVEPDLWA